MRIIFAGTPAFACPTLQALLDSQHDMLAVLTQPDRPAGRGRLPQCSPVKILAQKAGCTIYQPETLRSDAILNTLKALNADVMIVVAYGLLLPPSILVLPKQGCLNVHASILPRWRGASPIQMAILQGDKQTGVSIMQMEKGLDTGPVFAVDTCDITADMTAAMLHDKLAELGAKTLLPVLDTLEQKTARSRQQNDSQATYAPKITKKDALICWEKSAVDIVNMIHAFNPWPVAYSLLDKQTVRFWQAELLSEPQEIDGHHRSGEIIKMNKQSIDILAGDKQLVRLTQLQLPGKRCLPVSDVLNANATLFSPGRLFSSVLPS